MTDKEIPKNGRERDSFIRGNGLNITFKTNYIPFVNILKGNGYYV